MTQRKDVISDNNSPEPKAVSGIRMSITTKLVLSFLAVIIVSGVIFTVVGIFLISNHIENDAKNQAAHHLASAQDVYRSRLNQLEEVVARTASNNRLQDAITAQNMEQVVDELLDIHFREGLDILTVTSSDGTVLLRASDVDATGDNIGDENQIKQVLTSQDPFVSTATISNDELRRESGILADKVAAANANIRQTIDPYGDVMLISASAPIFSVGHSLIGTVWAGSILGADSSLICEISQSVFGGEQYEGKQIGFVTIYQGDTAILACPDQGDSAELIGTLLSTEKYDQVVALGEPWFGEDTVSDNTYITAYEPIRSSNGEIVGIMQIGELKQIYLDIRNQFIIAFLAVTVVGALIAMLFAYYIAQRISGPIKQLVAASSNVAHGDLNVRIDTSTIPKDETSEMAIAFNAMAAAIQDRDEKLREMATTRIGQAERLAIIGSLSAGVAHELNNPLQGIVTYSHLLIERMPEQDPNIDFVQKIVVQANRCRDIIRGLLDFARHGEHAKSFSNVNIVLQDCVALLENQAIFHNINITKEFDAQIPLVFIDPARIERVFINMIMNAAEAMDGEGDLALRTEAGGSGDYVVITIADSGHGIPARNLKRIFDPFFTTKEVGRGTGLGLAISYGIVKDHGGTISVVSKVGESTTFTIRLPVREGVEVPGGIELPDGGKKLTLLSGI